MSSISASLPRRISPRWLKLATHIGALVPLALLGLSFVQGTLSVNPVEEITNRTGLAGLVLLVLSLACTPINMVFGFKQIVAVRRLLGLYAFLYVGLHLFTFAVLDYGLNLGLIQQQIVEKRFVLVGFSAFLLLLPLAITSTRWWMRRLGKNWKRLHMLVYPAVVLAIVHFAWLVKGDLGEPIIYGSIVVGLLLLRLPFVRKQIKAWRARRVKSRNVPSSA